MWYYAREIAWNATSELSCIDKIDDLFHQLERMVWGKASGTEGILPSAEFSGQWTVDSGQWTVDSGQWSVVSDQ